jgi:hypothetical protein
MKEDQKILIYQTPDGKTQIDVRLEDETVWLTQTQMAELTLDNYDYERLTIDKTTKQE